MGKARFGNIQSDQDVLVTPAVIDDDCTTQLIGSVEILNNLVALSGSVQSALNAIVEDLNDLKAKLRTAGLLAEPEPKPEPEPEPLSEPDPEPEPESE